MPKRSSPNDFSKLNLPTSADMRGHTDAIGRVARAIESISRGITPRGDAGPTIITNPAPDGYERNRNTAFRIAATLGGTRRQDPLHIQVQQAAIEEPPSAYFLVPADQIMPNLGDTPINGMPEYRVRGSVEKGMIVPKFIIHNDSDRYRSSSHHEFQILPKGMQITRYESYYKGDHTLSWNSQEELADKINDTLRLIQKILDNPIIQPSKWHSDRSTITLRNISTDVSVVSAYQLLSVDRTRKISDFTPDFGVLVTQTLDNLLGYLQGEVHTNKKDYHGVKTEDILIQATYTKANTNMLNIFMRNLSFPCDLQSLRAPNFLKENEEDENSDIYVAIYTKAIQSGLQPKMINGDMIESFDATNAEHFLGLVRAIVHPTITDSQIKQCFKHLVPGLYQLIPRIPQPPSKKAD